MSDGIAVATAAEPAPSLPRRLAVTAGVVGALFAARWIDLPLIDAFALRTLVGASGGLLSAVALHLTPFVSAYLLVEVVALVHPGLRPLRHGSAADRLRLTRAAWLLAVLLAALQGWGLATYLQSLRGVYGPPVLDAGPGPALVVAVTLVAGTLVTAWGAVLISWHGVGNGFAILFAVDAIEQLVLGASTAGARSAGAWSETAALFAICLVVVVPLVLARQRRDAEASPQMPLFTCGLAVAQAPSVLLAAIAQVAALASVDLHGPWARAGAVEHAIVEVGVAAVAAVLSARLFCPDDAVVGAFRRAGADGEDAGGVRAALRAANRRSVAMVVGVVLASELALLLDVPVRVGAQAVLLVAIVLAVAADLRGEARARALHPALVCARPLHRVYAVAPALEALAAAGIPACARGRHYRGLFHFFAPWAPVEILVPPERAEEAAAICARVEVG